MPVIDGQSCPVCSVKLFSDDEDIVFCPDCGTAYHRECYRSVGHCVHQDHHDEMRKKAAEQPKAETGPAGAPSGETPPPGAGGGTGGAHGDHVGKPCPHCGRMATSNTLFCPYCGLDMNSPGTRAGAEGAPPPPPGAPFIPGFQGYRAQPPFGDVDPTAEIDGLPVAEVAAMVGVSTPRYIPRFFRMSHKVQKVSTNWGAFFFPELFFFYRKSYLYGAMTLLLTIAGQILMAPFTSYLANSELLKSTGMTSMLSAYEQALQSAPNSTITLLFCGIALTLIIKIICLIFADRIYKNRCISAVKEIKADKEIEDPHAEINKRGGVNIIIPALVLMFSYYLLPTIIAGLMP